MVDPEKYPCKPCALWGMREAIGGLPWDGFDRTLTKATATALAIKVTGTGNWSRCARSGSQASLPLRQNRQSVVSRILNARLRLSLRRRQQKATTRESREVERLGGPQMHRRRISDVVTVLYGGGGRGRVSLTPSRIRAMPILKVGSTELAQFLRRGEGINQRLLRRPDRPSRACRNLGLPRLVDGSPIGQKPSSYGVSKLMPSNKNPEYPSKSTSLSRISVLVWQHPSAQLPQPTAARFRGVHQPGDGSANSPAANRRHLRTNFLTPPPPRNPR